jgi:hypothetical protein
MEFGASIFFTDYSITPTELAVEMEERRFDPVWAAEHSHIPVPRPTARPGLSTGTIGGAPEDLDKLRRFRDLGAERVNGRELLQSGARGRAGGREQRHHYFFTLSKRKGLLHLSGLIPRDRRFRAQREVDAQ